MQRQQTERVAEERRQRAQELDDLARRAVTQMVSRHLKITRWWFQFFFLFTPTWGNDPI